MINKVVMPRMGASMEQGKILRWLKNEGDKVEKGDMVAEIETEKVNIEIESFAAGFLRKIIAQAGESIPVGGVIAVVTTTADEPLPPLDQLKQAGAEAAAPAGAQPSAAPAPSAPSAPLEAPAERERVAVSPVARRIAEEHHIDVATLHGSGPGGRIVKEDVEEAIAQQGQRAPTPTLPGVDGVEEIPLSRMRQAISHQMTTSKQNIPHFYVTMEIDMTEAERLRRGYNEMYGDDAIKVSVNDIVVLAAGLALKKHPQVNASLVGNVVHLKHYVSIGIAIALDEGLIVPVVHDVDKKSPREVALETKRLGKGARSRQLTARDVQGASFTVTNLGMFGAENFLAIINPPETAILAVGMIEEKPVVVDGAITVSQRMKLTLSGDHRVIDGAVGARFLQEVKTLLEKPLSLFVAKESA